MRPAATSPGRRSAASPNRGIPLVAIAAFIAFFALALGDGAQGARGTAALTLVIWWAVALGAIGGGLRAPGRLAALPLGGLALLVGMIGASLAWAGDDGRAYTELIRGLGYLGALLLALAALDRGRARQLLAGVLAAIGAVAMLALLSRLLPDLLTGDQSFLAQFPEAVRGRLSYPVGYWNGLAYIAAFGIVLAGWFAAGASNKLTRAAACALIPELVLVVYLTGSRGGLLAAAFGSALMVAMTPVRLRMLAGLSVGTAAGLALALAASADQGLVEGVSGRSAELPMLAGCLLASIACFLFRLRLDEALRLPPTPKLLEGRWLVAGAAASVLVLFLIGGGPERLRDSGNSFAGEAGRGEFSGRFLESGSSGRDELWKTALDAFGDEPLRGIGAGNFGYYWNQNGALADPVRDAHSLFLESLAELGLLGLAGVLIFFAGAGRAAAARTFGDADGMTAAAAGLIAAGFVACAFDWIWEVPAAFLVLIVAVGIAAGPACAVPAPRPRRLAGAPALAGLALVVLAGSGALYLSEARIDRSQELVAEGDLAGAAEAASEATSLMPLSESAWIQLGSVQAVAEDYEGAAESYSEAIERAPEDPRAYGLLAVTYQVLRDPRFDETQARATELLPADR